MSRQIEMYGGNFAIVDDEDFETLNAVRWHRSSAGYAIREIWYGRTREYPKGTLSMHRVILGTKPGEFVDHINHDRLDNRRSNLRICTRQQNSRNMSRHKKNSSQYKGVSRFRDKNKWDAHIRLNDAQYHLGRFSNEADAAKAYDAAAKEHFGEYACLNFPDNQEP